MGEDVDAELAQLLAAKAYNEVATRALELYGDEVYGFLIHHLGSEPDAAEVYGQMAEDLWKGLPTFAGRCSIRTWLYVLARHAAARFRRSPWNHRGRRTGDAKLDAAIAHQRTRTQPWQRTDVKDRFAALRETLDPDDRALLVLRVDRAMPWQDIARVTLDIDEPDAKALKRETDRLMKRFQLLKDQLRRRGAELGILGEDS
jgi:RNA polymerase sigma-70 factor (ECF subfamily)